MKNSAKDRNVIRQKEGRKEERTGKKMERRKGGEELSVKALPSEDLQLFSWPLPSYDCQHPYRLCTSYIRALWIILWVWEGFEWPPPNTHTITILNSVPLQCNSPALCSDLCSLLKGRAPIPIKGCWLGTPGLSRDLPFALFVLFCCLFLLLGLFTNGFHAAASLKKKACH